MKYTMKVGRFIAIFAFGGFVHTPACVAESLLVYIVPVLADVDLRVQSNWIRAIPRIK